jgi:hypothetical protein
VYIRVKQVGHDYCKDMLQKYASKNNADIQIKETSEDAEVTILPTFIWFILYNRDPNKIHWDEKENVYRLCFNTHFTNEEFESMLQFFIVDKNIKVRNMIGLCDRPIVVEDVKEK